MGTYDLLTNPVFVGFASTVIAAIVTLTVERWKNKRDQKINKVSDYQNPNEFVSYHKEQVQKMSNDFEARKLQLQSRIDELEDEMRKRDVWEQERTNFLLQMAREHNIDVSSVIQYKG
jgi:hypothetical protein